MSSRRRCLLLSFLLLVSTFVAGRSAVGDQPGTQYLLFQIFTGSAEGTGGVYRGSLPKQELLRMVRQIAGTVRPARNDPQRLLGFAVGPVAMDEGEDEARSVIRNAFDVALETGMAVSIHLDDYMFWAQARWPDGRQLRAMRGTTEWRDWSGASAGPLEIGWLPKSIKLAPQICYESPEVREFVAYWTTTVVGQEVKIQYDRLAKLGKQDLFAGIMTGWESNLSYGYCSLSHLKYSAQNPPADLERERERVLHRHIERWAKGVFDAGIPRHLIFTHIAPLPRSGYEMMSSRFSRAQLREMPGSAGFRAYSTAFNDYSNGGFSAYYDETRFEDIHQAVGKHGRGTWAMAEGTNVVLGAREGPSPSPVTWETYLGQSFNHGAAIVNLFGGFQGQQGNFQRSTESAEALAAYRKFLQGGRLVEQKVR